MFLVWLWISNVAVLLGAELNAELARTGEPAAPRSGEKPDDRENTDDDDHRA